MRMLFLSSFDMKLLMGSHNMVALVMGIYYFVKRGTDKTA